MRTLRFCYLDNLSELLLMYKTRIYNNSLRYYRCICIQSLSKEDDQVLSELKLVLNTCKLINIIINLSFAHVCTWLS